MTLTTDQQQTVDRAFERFLDVYTDTYRKEAGSNGDGEDRERAHHGAMWEGLAAVLFPPTNGHAPDRDDNAVITEAELFNGHGVDELVRNGRVPHALRRDLGMSEP